MKSSNRDTPREVKQGEGPVFLAFSLGDPPESMTTTQWASQGPSVWFLVHGRGIEKCLESAG